MKIAVAPTVLVMELLFFHKVPPPRVVAAVALVCLGIGVATVSDTKLVKNLIGLFVGLAATVVTALYQVGLVTAVVEKRVNARASTTGDSEIECCT